MYLGRPHYTYTFSSDPIKEPACSLHPSGMCAISILQPDGGSGWGEGDAHKELAAQFTTVWCQNGKDCHMILFGGKNGDTLVTSFQVASHCA